MGNIYKTPGVYIQELNAFSNSVVGVATAIPAFIGYTEKALYNGKNYTNIPFRITSLAEYIEIFGNGPAAGFTINPATDPKTADFMAAGNAYNVQVSGNYLLYNSMRLFFANGGSPCYIVSVGNYANPISSADIINGISTLENNSEVTLVLAPDAVQLADISSFADVANAMINHCGQLQSRMALLDVYKGNTPFTGDSNPAADAFRQAITSQYLNFAAAYFPFLNTNIVQPSEISYKQVTNLNVLGSVLQAETNTTIEALEQKFDEKGINNYLSKASPTYATMINVIVSKLNVLPPSGAMAGVYTLVDNSMGVWKAPANVSIANVISPAVSINSQQQQDLNVPLDGRAVNAIRSFVGQGVLVWGARTMDGNSLDWRYINVRRTLIYLEQSLKNYCRMYVFEPNTANTWSTVQSGISNFLTNVWKQGGLAGAKPSDAFSVSVGLGSTMTADDILNGFMNITIMVAIVRPAEFIVITFQQQMQQS